MREARFYPARWMAVPERLHTQRRPDRELHVRWTAARAAVQSFGPTKWLAAFEPVDREFRISGECERANRAPRRMRRAYFLDRDAVAARSKAAEEGRRPGRHRHRPECAHQCAQTRSEDHHSQPTPTKKANKKTGLKSTISGPLFSRSLSRPQASCPAEAEVYTRGSRI